MAEQKKETAAVQNAASPMQITVNASPAPAAEKGKPEKITLPVAPAAGKGKPEKMTLSPAPAAEKAKPEKKTLPAVPAPKVPPEPSAAEQTPKEQKKTEKKLFGRKPHTPDDAVSFMPDAIEIKNERLPLWARYSVLFSLAFFILALGWATFGKVDVVVKATGKLVSDQQNIVMKPLDSAVIKEIHVRVGDVVEKDQLLFTFDPTLTQADADRLQNEVTVLEAEYDRLRAEFEDREYKPAEKTPATEEQLSIFLQRAEYFRAKVRYYDEAIRQLDASEKTKRDTLANQQSRLETIRKMEQMYETLREKKTATLKELWNVQITRMEMEGSLDSIRNSIQELAHERESTVSARDGFIHEWKNSISESLVSTGRELDKNRELLKQAQRMVEYVELHSPCHAVVHEIANFPVGSAVREAEAIITLIPLDGKIEVEAELEPRDIGKVGEGSEVRIKLGAFPFQKYGTMHGVVRNISRDTIQRSSPSAATAAAAQNGMPVSGTYYRALITIDDTTGLRNLPSNFQMIPGMEVEAEIKTGRRRIIEYLTYPLLKALDESAREP